MKFRLRLVIVLQFILLQSSFSCDICGCFMGVSPGDRRSFVGTYYRFRSFSGTNVSGSEWFPDGSLKTTHGDHGSALSSGNQYELYRAVELRARYFIHQRIELNVVLPYLMNTDFSDGVSDKITGAGDMTIMAGWQMLDEKKTGAFNHRLLLGAGAKLATGDNNQQEEGVRYPFLVQTGTGSNDALLYLNYQLGYKNWGLSLTPVYKMNGTNRFNEQVGNSKTIFGSVFYKWPVTDELTIMPSIHLYAEHTKGLRKNDAWVKGTAMQSALLGPGFDVYWKNLGFTCSAQGTVYDKDNGSGLKSYTRLITGVTWYFNQQNFIISPKKR